MNKLDLPTITSLAERFIQLTTDAPKQSIVDQLGHHPYNHSVFARILTQYGHACDWQSYLACLAYIAVE